MRKIDSLICAVKEVPVDDFRQLEKEINVLKQCRSEWIVAYYGSYHQDGDIWVRHGREGREWGERGSGDMREAPQLFLL